MALVVKDRVKETAAAPGTGTVSLGGAASGFRPFSDIGSGNTTFYVIFDPTANTFEVGEGTYTSGSPDTLTRDDVLQTSANNTTKVNFANAVEVFIALPADKSVHLNNTDNLEIAGDLTVTSSNATDQIVMKNTNTGTDAAPDLVLWRDSSAAANGDSIGRIDFRGEDDGSTARNYTTIESKIVNVAAGAPTGAIHFKTLNASTSEADVLVISGNASTFSGVVNIGTAGSLSNNSGTFLIDANTNLNFRGGIQTFDNAAGSVEYMRISSDGVGIGIDPANARGGFTDLLIGQGIETGQGSTQPQIELYNSGSSWAINNDANLSNHLGFHYNNGSSWSQAMSLLSGGYLVLPQTGVLAFNSTSDEYITATASNLYFGVDNAYHMHIDGVNDHINFRIDGANVNGNLHYDTSDYFTLESNSYLSLKSNVSSTTRGIIMGNTFFKPFNADTGTLDLGTSAAKWKEIHSNGVINNGSFDAIIHTHRYGYNNSRNFELSSGGSGGDVGLYLKDAGSTAFVQLYGGATHYGFLSTAWGNWDLKKEKTGAMDLYADDAIIRLVSTGNNARGIEFIQGAAGSTPASGQTKKAAITWDEGSANLEIKNFRNDQNANNFYANIDFFTGGSGATTGSPDRRLRITDDGTVVIGDADLQYPVPPGGSAIKSDRKFQVLGHSSQYPMVIDSQDTDYALAFARQGTDEWWIKASSTDFQIHQNGVGDHLRIDNNGGVNITPSTGNSANDASLYINGPNGNDWGCVINKASGDYGLDIRGTSGSFAQRVTNGSETFRIEWNGTTYIQNDVYATRFRDVSNSSYYLDPASTSVINQFDSLGVGTARSGTTGEIRATNNITAYYSDERLKDFHGKIENAVDKVKTINGYYYSENEKAKEFGYERQDKIQVGVSAQEVEKVLPELVSLAPFDIGEDQKSKSGENYKTVDYARMIPLLIEAIKEQQTEIEELKEKVNALTK
jgi:hypothetical protein